MSKKLDQIVDELSTMLAMSLFEEEQGPSREEGREFVKAEVEALIKAYKEKVGDKVFYPQQLPDECKETFDSLISNTMQDILFTRREAFQGTHHTLTQIIKGSKDTIILTKKLKEANPEIDIFRSYDIIYQGMNKALEGIKQLLEENISKAEKAAEGIPLATGIKVEERENITYINGAPTMKA